MQQLNLWKTHQENLSPPSWEALSEQIQQDVTIKLSQLMTQIINTNNDNQTTPSNQEYSDEQR